MVNYKKTLKDGIYAIRILSVKKSIIKQNQYFIIEGQVLVDLDNYYFYLEDCIIKLKLKDNLYSIKKFISITTCLYRCYEAIYETSVKRSAAYDCIIGLEKIKDTYIWTDIKEYRYTNQIEKHPDPIPF